MMSDGRVTLLSVLSPHQSPHQVTPASQVCHERRGKFRGVSGSSLLPVVINCAKLTVIIIIISYYYYQLPTYCYPHTYMYCNDY